MALKPGAQVGPYQISAPLGAGGMGEVYRATDTKLKRDVAIKVLPDDVAGDSERLARFEREALVLASLNHPHIASIYGLEETGHVPCLVLELVEGQTLAEKLAAGPVAVEEALKIVCEIASALEAAHEKGVIHRDLKPANVKISPEGRVKVLDFGLAKAIEDESAEISGDSSETPTVSMPLTRKGMILGTAAYMSPEQARGTLVDEQTDIWAFGCVFYQLITGRQAFPGETPSDAIARVLEQEPDWQALPSTTPLRIRALLRRCLRKEPRDRLHDIADARIEIEEVLAEPSEPTTLADLPSASRGTWRRLVPWSAVGMLAVALGGLSWLHFRPAAPDIPVRLSINLPASVRLDSASFGLALSPDGSRLAVEVGRGDTSQIYLRELSRGDAQPLPGTEGGTNPFFSPDGEWVGYADEGEAKLKRVALDGRSPTVICDGVGWAHGSWGPDDSIIFSKDYWSGLWRVTASGGAPQALTTPDASRGELGHWWPQILPGGREVLYTSARSVMDKASIMVHSLESGEQRTIVEGGYHGRYVPTGHVLYARGTTLLAVPVEPERLEPIGPPAPVLDDVANSPADGWSAFSIAANGTMAFVSASVLAPARSLLWVDTNGTEQATAVADRSFLHPRLSPDGRQVALVISGDVWLYELSRGTPSRLTFETTYEDCPVWTADGEHVIYLSGRPQFDLYWRPADGSAPEELLYSNSHDKLPHTVSPDGKVVVFLENHPDTRNDIWQLSLEGEGEAMPLVRTPFQEGMAAFSPDGHWLAYLSNESGRFEVYVQAFPGPGRRHRISIDGVTAPPVWSRDGKDLFYLNGSKMMAVSIDGEQGLFAGRPRLLFEGLYQHQLIWPSFDVAPDGRLLMIKTPEELAPRQIEVVLDWYEELERQAPAE